MTSAEYKKQTLERLLRTKSKRLVIKPNNKGKNKVMWSQFDIAYLDGVEQQYACCKHCKCFVKYCGRTGTGGLMRHYCYKLFFSLKHDVKSQNKSFPMELQKPVEQEKLTSRLQIETLIHQGSPRIGFISNNKGKSDVWSQFQMITLDNEIVNFASCIACRNIVTYMSRTGTGSMTRHRCQYNNAYKKFLQNLETDKSESPPKNAKISEKELSDEVLVEVKSELFNNKWEKEKIKEEEEESEVEEEKELSEGNYTDYHESWRSGESWEGLKAQESLETKNRKSERECITTPVNLERIVQEKHLAFLKKSINLLNMFQNDEFLDFAQSLIDLGAQCGRIDARTLFQEKLDFVNIFGNYFDE